MFHACGFAEILAQIAEFMPHQAKLLMKRKRMKTR
jgi:hypothetical protein